METTTRTSRRLDATALSHTDTRTAFRNVKLLVAGYLLVGLAGIGVIAAYHSDHELVTDAAQGRGVAIVISALLTMFFAFRAAQGVRRAYLRVRIVSVVLVAVLAVLAALPGVFPVWMRIEQGVCGLILLGVALIVNGKHLRTVFARR